MKDKLSSNPKSIFRLLGNGRLARISLIVFISVGVIAVFMSMQAKTGVTESKKAVSELEKATLAGANSFNETLAEAQKNSGMTGLTPANPKSLK